MTLCAKCLRELTNHNEGNLGTCLKSLSIMYTDQAARVARLAMQVDNLRDDLAKTKAYADELLDRIRSHSCTDQVLSL